jgi:hypothetical protein
MQNQLFFLTGLTMDSSRILLKPGPAWQVDPGLEPGRVDEKIGKFMTRCNPAGPEKPGCNPLTFFLFFFTKTTPF